MLRKKSETIKEESKRIKNTCKALKNIKAIHEWLDFYYERITNKEVNIDTEKYNFVDIVKNSKQVARFDYNMGKNSIAFEFLDYFQAPKSFLLIYNEFKGKVQISIDMYILKKI